MLGTTIRPLYQRWLVEPLARKLQYICKPNQITYLAGFIGALAAIPIALDWPVLATLLLLLSGYCDTLDGTLARMRKDTSSIGAVLDIVCDRWVEFMVVLGLFLANPAQRGLLIILMLGSMLICITSFLVVGIFSTNDSEKSFHYSPGLVERMEAFVFFIAMIWLPGYFYVLASLFSVLVFLTAFLRIQQFMRQQSQVNP